jgi:hypothetical protein
VILPVQIDQKTAASQIKAWLGKGLTAPDDLSVESTNLQIELAYYPFWTFDGFLEYPWVGEVNVGSNNHPRWVTRSGSDFKIFDDVLVPGLTALEPSELSEIEPFKLKEVIEFKPEFLAGWAALSYNIPLAAASLKAREIVLKQVREDMESCVEPGRQKRNIRIGAGKWSGLTYKYALLPIWIGRYHYRGSDYIVLVNGQTGKVGGSKPQDIVKVILLIAITLVMLGALVLVSTMAFLANHP